MYDLIIGLEHKQFEASQFQDRTATIDYVELTIHSRQSLCKILYRIPSIRRQLAKRCQSQLCKHLSLQEQNALTLYGTLGAWREWLMSNELKPYHGPPFPKPSIIHHDTILKIKIVVRLIVLTLLVEIGILKPIQESEWAFSFIIPNKPKGQGLPGISVIPH